MAGFLKKIFSFGKKEVVQEPATEEELKPIDWSALRDLTKSDDAGIAAEQAASEAARREQEEAARKAAEEEATRLAEQAAVREAEEQRAKAEAELAAQQAAEKAAAETAAREAAMEVERQAEVARAEREAREAALKREADENAAAEREERQAAERAAREQAAKDAREANTATELAAQEAAVRLEADARAREEQERQAAAEKADREAAEAKEAENARQAEAARLEQARLAEEAAAREAAEAQAAAEREAQEAADRKAATEAAEAKAVEAREAEARRAKEQAEQAAKAAAEAAKKPAFNPGLRTGGDELLAPAWMTQQAQPKPVEPEPEPEDDDPTNKVTVGKTVEQKQARVAPAPEVRVPWFQRLSQGLQRSSRELSSNIAGVFTKRKLDDDTLQDLEEILLRADLGLETAMRVTDALASSRYGREISDFEVRTVMGAEVERVLKPVAKPLELDLSHKPHVILVVGVNGTGKTTTIGKLAAKLKDGGLDVMLAAGDTFRAAAIEQLKIWGERTGSTVISSKLGADAAGLAYDAFEKAKEAGSDVLIIDTAGRLQNKAELMAELEKIVRVLGKLDPDAPHTVLQTVDATTGQNALNQVEIFRNVTGVNGLVMTKLDGTARGGILVAIAAKHKLPVYFIGVGEQVDDLEPFSAGDFAKAIAGVG